MERVQVLYPLFNSRMLRLMLSMHEEEKEVVIYVTTERMHALEGEVGEDGSVGADYGIGENENALDYLYTEKLVVKEAGSFNHSLCPITLGRRCL